MHETEVKVICFVLKTWFSCRISRRHLLPCGGASFWFQGHVKMAEVDCFFSGQACEIGNAAMNVLVIFECLLSLHIVCTCMYVCVWNV